MRSTLHYQMCETELYMTNKQLSKLYALAMGHSTKPRIGTYDQNIRFCDVCSLVSWGVFILSIVFLFRFGVASDTVIDGLPLMVFVFSGLVASALSFHAFLIREHSNFLMTDVDTENPKVVAAILEYLKKKVLTPKQEFSKKVDNDVSDLTSDLLEYEKDEEELRDRLSESASEQEESLDASALIRVQLIIPELQERKDILVGQLHRAEEIVRPVTEQVEMIEHHLRRLTRDQRLVESRELTVKIDKNIPMNEESLVNLAFAVESAVGDLRELSDQSIALAAAVVEVHHPCKSDEEDVVSLSS